jgi:hypothetical protein
LPASISRPRRRKAAAWSRPCGFAITRQTSGRTSSTRSCSAGTPQQGLRAQRFQRVHKLGHQRQGPLSLTRAAPAHGISRIEARGVRAMRGLRGQCRADRGQGLGHPAARN